MLTQRRLETIHDELQAHAQANTSALRERELTLTAADVAEIYRAEPARPRGEGVPPLCEKLTKFHSKRVPPLTLHELATAMRRNTNCGEETIAITLTLLARYCRLSRTALTLHSMHRLFVTCLHVAIKAHHDRYFNNAMFARLTGVALHELNGLEIALLNGLRWQCIVHEPQTRAMLDDPAAWAKSEIPRAVTLAESVVAARGVVALCATPPSRPKPMPILRNVSQSDFMRGGCDGESPRSSCLSGSGSSELSEHAVAEAPSDQWNDSSASDFHGAGRVGRVELA